MHVETMRLETLMNWPWAVLQAGILFFFFLSTAHATENYTVENSNLVPVVSADASVNESPNPLAKIPGSAAELSPLSKPTDSVFPFAPDKLSFADLLKQLDLTNAEQKQFVQILENIEKRFSSDQSHDAATMSKDFRDIFRELASLVQNSSHPEQVQKAIVVAIANIFDRLEKKSAEIKTDSNETQAAFKAFESLLKQEEKTIAPVLKNEIEKTNSATLLKNTAQATSHQVQKLDQTLTDVLEVLRQGAVNENTTALQRAIYRNWYLSIAQKTRVLRLNRLRAMITKQRRVENFKVPSPQQ